MPTPVNYEDGNVQLIVEAISNWQDKGISPQFICERVQAIANEYLYHAIHADK